jgi:hypothetical protein
MVTIAVAPGPLPSLRTWPTSTPAIRTGEPVRRPLDDANTPWISWRSTNGTRFWKANVLNTAIAAIAASPTST